MSNVIPLLRPLPIERLIAAIKEIVDGDTNAIVLIAACRDGTKLRTFGDLRLCERALNDARLSDEI